MNRQKVWCPNWLEAAGVHAEAIHQDPLRHHLDGHGADGLDAPVAGRVISTRRD